MARAKNVHHLEEGHLVRAKQHAAEAESLGRKSIEAWARCADEIIAAKGAAKADGRKLTNVDVGRAMSWAVNRDKRGFEDCTKVRLLLAWRKRSDEDTSEPPFGGAANVAKSDRSDARRAVRNNTEVVIAEALKHPDIARRIIRDLQVGLAAAEPDKRNKYEPKPSTPPKRGKHPHMNLEDAEREFGPSAQLNPDGSVSVDRAAFEERIAKLKAETAQMEEEERAEAEAEEREAEEAARKHAEYEATPLGRVEKLNGQLLFYRLHVMGVAERITPDLFKQLTPTQRRQHATELAGYLEELQTPVETALAVCRAAMSTKQKD